MLHCLCRRCVATSTPPLPPPCPIFRSLSTTTVAPPPPLCSLPTAMVEISGSGEIFGRRGSSASYDVLTNNALKNSDFDTVSSLICSRVHDGYFPTARTFKHVASPAWLSSLEQLTNTLAALDCGAYGKKKAFECLVLSLCKENYIEQARSVLQSMIAGGFGANAVSFLPLVSKLARKKAMDEVEEVFQWMRESGIPPDVTCHNCVLSAYGVSGRCQEAAEVVKKMEDEGLVPDSVTYDALVMAACRAQKLEAALGILGRMLDEGTTILYCTYLEVLKVFLRKLLFEEALKFALGVCEVDRSAAAENLGFLARWCERKKWVERKRLVEKEMEQRGFHSGGEMDAGGITAAVERGE